LVWKKTNVKLINKSGALSIHQENDHLL